MTKMKYAIEFIVRIWELPDGFYGDTIGIGGDSITVNNLGIDWDDLEIPAHQAWEEAKKETSCD